MPPAPLGWYFLIELAVLLPNHINVRHGVEAGIWSCEFLVSGMCLEVDWNVSDGCLQVREGCLESALWVSACYKTKRGCPEGII